MSNIIRDRHDELVRAFKHSLEQCAKALDEGEYSAQFKDDIPSVIIATHFTFPATGLAISSCPEFDLSKPIPDPIPEPVAYVVGSPDDPDRTIQP
jgi:hypothetical protein